MSAAISRSEPAAPDRRFQRSEGRLELCVGRSGDVSHPTRVFQQGCLKVRFPGRVGAAPEAVMINLAGGLTGGDALVTRISVMGNARATVTSQAYERVYRSLGDDAQVDVRVAVEPGGTLHYLPQATLLFEGARLKRRTEFDLGEGASLLAVEAIVFGRAGMKETVRSGALDDAAFVRRGGMLVHADRFALEGDIQATLDRPAVLAGNRAVAVLRYFAADAEERVGAVRSGLAASGIDAAASAWNGTLIVRFVAPDGYRLHRALSECLAGFGALPRIWNL